MSHRSIRRVAATLPILVLAVTGFAPSSAAARSDSTCGPRTGKTVLENADTRVFTVGIIYYACARAGTRVHTLGVIGSVSDVELAGQYVGWELNAFQPYGTLHLLDVRAARGRTVATMPDEGVAGSSALAFFVLTDRGTIVWVLSTSHCDPESAACTANSTVHERSSSRSKTLARVTDHEAAYPITSLGISAGGSIVYWIANGAYKAARIS
jgi:hypothetical protein